MVLLELFEVSMGNCQLFHVQLTVWLAIERLEYRNRHIWLPFMRAGAFIWGSSYEL